MKQRLVLGVALVVVVILGLTSMTAQDSAQTLVFGMWTIMISSPMPVPASSVT